MSILFTVESDSAWSVPRSSSARDDCPGSVGFETDGLINR